MGKATKTTRVATPEQIEAFRLQRHHLLDSKSADPITIARDICGVQAQVMSAAYLQFWARNHSITKAAIKDLLFKSRTLVKTSLMRRHCTSFLRTNFLFTSVRSEAREWPGPCESWRDSESAVKKATLCLL